MVDQPSTERTADDMVAEADTGARNPSNWQGRLIIGTCIAWSLFQLYIASRVPGMVAEATGMSIFANIVAQVRPGFRALPAIVARTVISASPLPIKHYRPS